MTQLYHLKITAIPEYQIEDHFNVDHRHCLIRCAHNRYHWWHYDSDIVFVGATEMVIDDFGTLVPVS